MSDLISRQAAIDATRNAKISFTIKSDIDFANYRKEMQEIFNNILDAQEKALNDLPPAQPEKRTNERTETHACDLISRQAVIDAIVAQTIGYTVDEIKAECEENIFNENGYLGGLKDAIEAIEDMPSAQPEREKGHWIDKTDPDWDGEWDDWQCSCCGSLITSMAINLNGLYLYCPKCGADMRRRDDEH